MAIQQFDYQELLQLIELIKSSSQFSEFKLRSGDLEIELRRGPAAAPASAGSSTPAPAPVAAPVVAAPVPAPVAAAPVPAPAAPSASPAARPARAARAEGSVVISSPMVGTVYRAPEPGATPFVEVGQTVTPTTTLCIIEVMKLMNTINADCHGVVTEILAKDGEAVEFGRELFVIAAK